MKKWVLKAIVQKIISYLPMGNKINYLFQKYITKGVYLTDEYFYDRLGHARDHLNAGHAHTHTHTHTDFPKSCLELGTGWYPIVPIGFFLAGAEKIYSVDISFLTSKERITTTISRFVDAHQKGVLSDYVKVQEGRLAILLECFDNIEELSLEDILRKLKIEYLITDARKLPLPDNSIDLVNSNNTFEHIYPEILTPILKEFKRVVNKEHGVMSHFIDMSDHFAHFDHSINVYNFLQFTNRQWRWIDNSIQPQSRLRIDDYRHIYHQLGIPISEEKNRPGDVDALKTIKLDERFVTKPLDVVAISHCQFISKMKDA
ncbi:MAG: class I SAM-dependent methyltransferase [Saprospiraceae bacterium]|nr:class I SAM-dependent methyltransferase [Saprospiraceae bacterium]